MKLFFSIDKIIPSFHIIRSINHTFTADASHKYMNVDDLTKRTLSQCDRIVSPNGI